jgi:hypothetical protein
MKCRISTAMGILVLGGCGFNSGFIRDAASISQREYRMDVVQERFVRTVSGSASTGSVFCLFPISSDMYSRAMHEMYDEAKLQPNQTVLNLREDHETTTYLGLYCNYSLTISGDKVEMTPAKLPPPEAPPEAPVSRYPAPAAMTPATAPLTNTAPSEPMTGRCASDDSCPHGSACVKAQFALEGYCAQPVNSVGTPTSPPPNSAR